MHYISFTKKFADFSIASRLQSSITDMYTWELKLKRKHGNYDFVEYIIPNLNYQVKNTSRHLPLTQNRYALQVKEKIKAKELFSASI